ncbi:plasmid recombination enzyme [Pacificibacter maritimus]|uniref:Plasmid recombination enzyme n=1 Tax=Pacificibacter maritimus TaxID=762213 RepID=A0A3N4UXA6_9RHOB|nr:plasmid recombination enzyme [Pacificibacter maritimus]
MRLKARSLKRAYGQRRHDFRIGQQPNYVDQERTCLNRILIEPRPLPEIKKEIERLRRSNGAQRAMKSDAAVVTAGIATFGHKAADLFATLSSEEQDAALQELVSQIAKKLGTRIEAMVVHLDETSLHAHFELRAYNDDGVPVSKVATFQVMSELQDMTADVLGQRCPGIERGHKKFHRIEVGADYAETLNRSVKKLHKDLPDEIAARQGDLKKLEEEKRQLDASMTKTQGHLQRLYDKGKLNEKEAKRLKTYEGRLAKKEAEQSEIQRRQLDMMTKLEKARHALKNREAEVQEHEVSAREKMEDAKASLVAIEAVAEELEQGTLQQNDAGKIQMKDASPVLAAPAGIRKRLFRLARRLLWCQERLVRKENRLNRLSAALKGFLKRQDLSDDARAEGEELERGLDDGQAF